MWVAYYAKLTWNMMFYLCSEICYLLSNFVTLLNTFYTCLIHLFSQRHWSPGLVCIGASLTSWGEGASLALVGHPSSDGVTMKVPYVVDVLLHRSASHPSFPIGLVKTKSNFIVRSVETGLGRWMLVVAMISVDNYPFLAFSDLTCHLQDTGIGVFWLHCTTW